MSFDLDPTRKVVPSIALSESVKPDGIDLYLALTADLRQEIERLKKLTLTADEMALAVGILVYAKFHGDNLERVKAKLKAQSLEGSK